MKISDKIISTFAKNMLCPPSLLNKECSDLASQGLNDFESYKYRHLSKYYRGDSEYTEESLIDKIKLSLSDCLKSDKAPLLLLSDGKDSMSLAVGFSELKVSCETLTLLRKDDDELKSYIQKVAFRLGHKPFFVTVEEILGSYDSEAFLKACGEMETPVLDQAFFFFLFGVKSFFDRENKDPQGYVIIDGLGNDEYFGYIPSKNQLSSYKLSRLGLWELLPDSARAWKWYVRSPSESNGDLSALSCFFPIPNFYDLNRYFSRVPSSISPLEFVDFRAFSRGSFHDHQCMMGKTSATAKFLEADVNFPWVYFPLSDYCFNLPVDQKFDFKGLENKLPLRKMLKRKVDWCQDKRGVDLYFDLNMSLFKEKVVSDFVPGNIVDRVDSVKVVPSYVKKRAYLELINLYGYCISHGYKQCDVERILMG
jgi:asparagine synthetase B (glutamine-hydrolysing)